jgi:tetraacyldisaccharide 4'-kinase
LPVRAPEWWARDGTLPRLLSPIAALVTAATAHRLARPRWRAPVPVLCCGNASVGGSGKTTLARDLGARLAASRPAFLLRGYGGRVRGVREVAAGDDAALVGDEALLLAPLAPTWVGADRAAAARAAVAAGAGVLILDDGLQNPSLAHDLALLVIDGGSGFGNGRVLPSGPLREPVARAAARVHAAVLIGEDRTGALDLLPPELPVLRAELRQRAADIAGLGRRPVLAFAGIGRPEKFFAGLRDAGVEVAATAAFADHHPYTEAELARLFARADAARLTVVTTPKDAARLSASARARVTVVDVALQWREPERLATLLAPFLAERGP